MSALLALLVLAAFVWVAGTMIGRPGQREPMHSVAEFNRSLAALDPTRRPGAPTDPRQPVAPR